MSLSFHPFQRTDDRFGRGGNSLEKKGGLTEVNLSIELRQGEILPAGQITG
jgi:hypothetical protein